MQWIKRGRTFLANKQANWLASSVCRLMKLYDKKIVKFIFFGGLNTILGYALYLVLLLFLPYQFAYTLSFILGIAIAYCLQGRFVFYKNIKSKSFIVYPFVYLINYILGLLILHFLINYYGLSPQIAAVISTISLTPFSFLFNQIFFKGFLNYRSGNF